MLNTWFSGAIVFLTVGLLVVGFLQWWVSSRQAKIAETQASIALAQKRIGDTQTRHMEEGLKVAQISAEAAKQSADTASRSLTLLNRPYLDADNWRASLHRGLGYGDPQLLTIAFDIGNPSPTPARLETITINEGIGGQPATEFKVETTINATIGPQHNYPFTVQITIGEPDFLLMVEGRLMVHVFGQFDTPICL